MTRFTFGFNPTTGTYRQLDFNALNNRHVKQGTLPFNGDYNHGAVVEWVFRDGSYVSSVGRQGVPEIVQLAWVDNREMRGNMARNLTEDEPIGWAPSANISEPDTPFPILPVCNPDNPLTGTRDQQIYAASLFPDLYLTSASASNKGLGNLNERPYAIFVRNTTNELRNYTLEHRQSARRRRRHGVVSATDVTLGHADGDVDFEIPARSSVARTVYINSTWTSRSSRSKHGKTGWVARRPRSSSTKTRSLRSSKTRKEAIPTILPLTSRRSTI